MPTFTPNLSLELQGGGERASLAVLNENLFKLDTFAGLLMIDYGTKSVTDFQAAIGTTMNGVGSGQSISFMVNLSDSVSPMSSGTHTGIATKSASTRFNVVMQRSGSTTNDTYLGSLTSNGWSWNKVVTNSQMANVAKRTQISATSTNYTEVYEFPNGMVVLCARLTVSAAITSTSGGIYYGTIPAMDWGYTFADRPTVTVTARSGTTNGWVWQQSGATTTQTPALYIGRGTSASGNVVLEFHAVGYRAV